MDMYLDDNSDEASDEFDVEEDSNPSDSDNNLSSDSEKSDNEEGNLLQEDNDILTEDVASEPEEDINEQIKEDVTDFHHKFTDAKKRDILKGSPDFFVDLKAHIAQLVGYGGQVLVSSKAYEKIRDSDDWSIPSFALAMAITNLHTFSFYVKQKTLTEVVMKRKTLVKLAMEVLPRICLDRHEIMTPGLMNMFPKLISAALADQTKFINFDELIEEVNAAECWFDS